MKKQRIVFVQNQMTLKLVYNAICDWFDGVRGSELFNLLDSSDSRISP
jgi:hypothetical protein